MNTSLETSSTMYNMNYALCYSGMFMQKYMYTVKKISIGFRPEFSLVYVDYCHVSLGAMAVCENSP